MALRIVEIGQETANELAEQIREYNETVVEETGGPTKWDFLKEAKRIANEEGSKEAQAAVKAYEDAQTAATLARVPLFELGAASLGVEFDASKAEATDEDKEAAKEARKQLTSTLKMLADFPESATWANGFMVPAVGSHNEKQFGQAGTARHRVSVTVVGPDDFSQDFDSLSELKVTSNSKPWKDEGRPSVDVNQLRDAYESADEAQRDAGITGELADGWSVTVTAKPSK